MKSATPVRLTRRGRMILLLLLVAVAFVSFSVARTATQAGTERARPATRYVTVHPGQTLWEIARTAAPGDDPRETVGRIRALNQLDTTILQAGQRLVVPL